MSSHQFTFDQATVVAEPYFAMRGPGIFATMHQSEAPETLLCLAAANRLAPEGFVRPEPRLTQGHTPLEQGQFRTVLARCIKEKRKMMYGW